MTGWSSTPSNLTSDPHKALWQMLFEESNLATYATVIHPTSQPSPDSKSIHPHQRDSPPAPFLRQAHDLPEDTPFAGII